MVSEVQSYDSKTLLGVSRSFSNFLALANSAENHHRIRRLRTDLIETNSDLGLWHKPDSFGGNIKRLREEGIKPKDITKALAEMKVELVLTAHPTEVNRRTILKKHKEIRQILVQLDHSDLTGYERKQLNNQLKSLIMGIWESDDLRRTKPTPLDEAKTGITMVENVFWDAVPSFIRKMDDIVIAELGEEAKLPVTYTPLKIASWMGGDRDGNPNVTPEITYETSMLSRWTAATLFKQEIAELRSELSMVRASDELHKLVGEDVKEPYRELLKKLEGRLQATIDWTTAYLKGNQVSLYNSLTFSAASSAAIKQPLLLPIHKTSDLLDPLLLIHRSLMEKGMNEIANGSLLDVIRRVTCFGPALMPIDIRQESTRHSEALDAITKHLKIGSYLEWNEEKRREWLTSELSSKRPLLPRNADYQKLGFSKTVIDTLKTFEVAAKIERESLGAYVISQCQQASDILAVTLLQQDSGVTPLMRVVPLFETLDDLQRAKETVEALFSFPIYKEIIQNKQEIMVGYSDSAKDAGRIAASWAQYNSQLAMVEVAKKHNIELTFFHGKGGTVGRGGNPALYKAILAHPPGTINGRFRVTEQGEMITQNFGEISVAERTFDLIVSGTLFLILFFFHSYLLSFFWFLFRLSGVVGVLNEQFLQRKAQPLKQEWIDMMERLSTSSCEVYRQLVRKEANFVPYFRTATPEIELSYLNVGSRPAKRNPKGGVDSLRAIPWNFAWTQTRLNLPTWLGVGDAFNQELSKNPTILKEMFSQWSWFATLIDLLEMILVKSDSIISENYDHQLISPDETDLTTLGKELREKLFLTSKSVLAISEHSSLQSHNEMLLRSMSVRNPYIDPLNIIQAEVLKRLRNHRKITEEK
jgi:phosphoenolpyruvate carboxylase